MMLRDRLFVEDSAAPAFLERLRQAGIEQAMILSTCDRVEVQAIAAVDDGQEKSIIRVMAEHAQLKPGDINDQIYILRGEDAVRHVFTVTSSLDSLMIGEPQVLGQVKAGHRMARDADMSGSELESLLQAAFAVAKQVRSETAIGQRPVSMAAVAAQLAGDVHGDLSRCSGLLIGSGDMGELVAGALISAGLVHLTATHPVASRGEAVARTLDCHLAPFENLPEELVKADIILTSVGGRNHVLNADLIEASLRKRRFKPMFMVDTGVPGDVDPAVNRIEEVFLYDLSDLERVAMEGRASRESEVSKAMNIINAEVALFMRGRAERTAAPAVCLLRAHFEKVRDGALADAGGDAEKATHLLINRLLHDPSKAMREIATMTDEKADGWEAVESTLRRLFNLHDNEPPC
ncbi:MAG: glutamyl-tRNA reductase [Rhodospirillales bacterium RIFCSPLOWO2_12_FULL_58_28]|nr:MAG: glutamyl-tRNA reductase [Rhodospirillales bacterium RIFCSPLOWO2_02_FULL_58_16]OHC77836.1 MAG: glutamyl-tRNA reductase [Rhodospirillales bacterium RIFCSPLOWO2_12_FULL_58_28]